MCDARPSWRAYRRSRHSMHADCDREIRTNWRYRFRREPAWCREERRLSRRILAFPKARLGVWWQAFVQSAEQAQPKLSPACDRSRRAKTKMRTAERTASFARGRLLFHEVCQFLQLRRGHAQGLCRMLTHRWHDFVVQVLDKLGGFLLDSFRGIADRFVDARGSVLDFAVEIVHKSFGPRAESCWTWQTSHYFLTGAEGQSPTCDNRLDCRRITIPSAMKRSARMEARDVAGLRRALLAWYEKSRRDLPWRKTRDPYRVWVSEIMLQQTRVAVVIPRYKKFLHRFQSVEKLASARVTSVLAEWSGLGYYRRARNLHAAAKIVARAGKFPKDAEGRRELPRIGRYTAAAIASIAFDEPVAGLDGNVERVLRRLAGQTQTSAQAWGAAQSLLDHDRPGDFNQAMMEL